MGVTSTAAIALTTLLSSAADSAAQEAKVKEVFDEFCTSCHDNGDNPPAEAVDLNLDVPLGSLIGMPSAATGQALVVPGDPDASYLMLKMKGGKGMDGDTMPLAEDLLPPKTLKIVATWIEGLPANEGGSGGGGGGGGSDAGGSAAPSAAADPAKEARVKEIFEDKCTVCHEGGGNPPADPSEIDLAVPPNSLIGLLSATGNGQAMVVPGKPEESYLLMKMEGAEGIEGDPMPIGDEMLPEELDAVRDWIATLPPPSEAGAEGGAGVDVSSGGSVDGGAAAPGRGGPKPRDPFNGTTQIVLPTTTTLGKRKLQYRIDHRFGRIGTERGAFGLDGGVSMAMGLTYGIVDGWDVQLRRANSRKTWELGTKYIPIRQEDGKVLSFGGYASMSLLRDFGVGNKYLGDELGNKFTGDLQLMISRLWFDRWSTMLTLGYHFNTNHSSQVSVDFGDGNGPVPVEDRRDTLTMGLASTVLLGKKKRWGLDMEYVLPIPDGGEPNLFYYRGGDADPGGSRIGAWSIGGSLRTAKHFFQVFFTNNREISTNLYAPGGQSGNPFVTEGVDSGNPFHRFNFFLGFNLGRQFTIKAPKGKKSRKKENSDE